MNADQFFSDEARARIVGAIEAAELATSGEIRLHIENFCKADVLDRAAFVFEKLGMKETAERNGVLFYLALSDKKFAIIGDAGINAKVPANFWEDVKNRMLQHFLKEGFEEGLVEGINMAGHKLGLFFPRNSNDINELPNDISFE